MRVFILGLMAFSLVGCALSLSCSDSNGKPVRCEKNEPRRPPLGKDYLI